MITTLEHKHQLVREVMLNELAQEHVIELVRDTVLRPDCTDFADAVYRKASGNPFVVNCFLTSMEENSLIYFNHNVGKWEWNISKVLGLKAADNVVDMLIKRIQQFPFETQVVMSLAASIGNRFNLKVLSIINESNMKETAKALWPAVKDGLVIHFGHRFSAWIEDVDYEQNAVFQFLHDRVQQSAYQLVEQEERIKIHLKIGKLLLHYGIQEENVEDKLLEILPHFQIAKSLLTDYNEKLVLAEYHLMACYKAKKSSAFHAAADCAINGINLIPECRWESLQVNV